MTEKMGRSLVILMLLGFMSFLLLLVYVFAENYNASAALVKSSRASCERIKQDRRDNVEFQKAHIKYIERLITAKESVPKDIREAAKEAIITFKRTSEDLTLRLDINCIKAFSKANYFP